MDKVFEYLGFSHLVKHVARHSIGLLAVKATAIMMGFTLSIVLSRGLGATGYGQFTFLKSIFHITTLVATLGFGNLIVREVQKYKVNNDWGKLKGLKYFSQALVLVTGLLAAVGYYIYYIAVNSSVESSLIWGLFIPMVAGFLKVQQSILRGYKKIVQAELISSVLMKASLMGPITVLYFFASNYVNLEVVVVTLFSAYLISGLSGYWFVERINYHELKKIKDIYLKKNGLQQRCL